MNSEKNELGDMVFHDYGDLPVCYLICKYISDFSYDEELGFKCFNSEQRELYLSDNYKTGCTSFRKRPTSWEK